MKKKSNFLSKYMLSKKYKLKTDKKDRKIFLKNDISKNLKNFNISLVLKREKEKEMHKANSTTQTGQKSIIFHTNYDNIMSENTDNKSSEKIIIIILFSMINYIPRIMYMGKYITKIIIQMIINMIKMITVLIKRNHID